MEGAGVWGHTGNSIKAVRAFLRNLCTLSLDPPTPWVCRERGYVCMGGNV